MRLKTLLFFTTYFLAALYLALPAYADMIEVKGKGVVTGDIVKQDEDSVTFKDDYGNTTVYSKSKVTFLEKQSRSKAVAGPRHSGVSGLKKGTKDSGGLRLPFQGVISGVTDNLSQKWYDFLTEDPEPMKDYIQSLAARPEQIQSRVKELYRGRNPALAYSGMAVLAIGMLAAVVFGFKVMWIAFGEGALWGLAFLGNGLVVFSNRIGPSIGVVLLAPHLISLYFIFSRWRLVRKCVVGQIFCFDLLALGALMIKIAF